MFFFLIYTLKKQRDTRVKAIGRSNTFLGKLIEAPILNLKVSKNSRYNHLYKKFKIQKYGKVKYFCGYFRNF